LKNIILALLLAIVVFIPASAQVSSQQAVNSIGQPFIRIYNMTPRYVSCYYRDQFNYFTFVISPNSYSMWYPIYGQYEWRCV